MINIARLKQNLDFNKNLGELIEIMKLASTTQFNQFRSYRQAYPEFSLSLERILSLIPEKQKGSIFFTLRQDAPAAVILITSDEGFLGELNAALTNKLMEIRSSKDEVIALGQQGEEYLKEMNIAFQSFPPFGDKPELEQVESIRDYVFELYRRRSISRVWIIYARFQGVTSQTAESELLLPISPGLFSPEKKIRVNGELLIEPDADSLMEGWVRLWLFSKLYQIFWSGKLSEFGARIMHLEASFQELSRTNQNLRLEYFKYLHGLSDKTIREIYASRLMRKT